MNNTKVVSVERVEFTVSSWQWPFVVERRAEIDRYFLSQQRVNPTLWNGRLLLLRDFLIKDRVLSGRMFECDYASLLAGLAFDAIESPVMSCFGAAALQASDDAYVVGLMAAHTRNAGQLLFPSGSIDPDDALGKCVDLDRCIQRELTEETGLDASYIAARCALYAVFAGPQLPILRVMRANEPAQALRDRILTNISSDERPEFSDIQIIRSPHDIGPRMPLWMQTFLTHIWS
jgi:8-oxo-dGTP pyrophosphatase MutT (NUDIX family)